MKISSRLFGFTAISAALSGNFNELDSEFPRERLNASAFKHPLFKLQKKRRAKEKRAKLARKINYKS